MTGFVGLAGSSIYTSTDGLAWTERSTGVGAAGVAHAPDLALFVVVEGDGGVRTSPDGLTWTDEGNLLPTPGSGEQWHDVVWASGMGLFIAVGTDGMIATSPDGLAWTNRDQGSTDYSMVAYSDTLDRLLVCAPAGVSRYSDDGITWTSVGGNLPFDCAAWSPTLNLWVGIRMDQFGSSMFYTSPDAVTWTHRVTRSSVHADVVWAAGEGKFVAVGDDNPNYPDQKVAYSSDGITWTFRTITGTSYALRAVAYSPDLDLFTTSGVAVGHRFTSTDAHNWTQRTPNLVLTDIIWADTNRAPNAPTITAPVDGSTIDRSSTQRFSWSFSDPNPGDSQSAYDLRYRVVGAPTWTDVPAGSANTFHDFPAATFTAGDYEWQVRTYDAQGEVGPYSGSSFFTAADAPAGPSIVAPLNGATVVQAETVTWSTADQDAYQLRRVADNAGAADTATVYFDTGEVVNTVTRSRVLDFETNDRWEHVQLRVKDGGLWSAWASVRVLVSYTPPAAPTVTLSADDPSGSLWVGITNPTPGGGEPTAAYNSVEVDDGDGWERRATYLATNTGWRYWTPKSGRDYSGNVRVVAHGSNGTTATTTVPAGTAPVEGFYYGGGY